MSYNAWRGSPQWKKDNYKNLIIDAFTKFHSMNQLQSGELYGIIYYFFKNDLGSDADNLSKPIWDCLKGFAYEDDKQVRLRIAGSFNFERNAISILDLTNLSNVVVHELIDAFNNEEHFVYVEIGSIGYSMFKFNLTQYGN